MALKISKVIWFFSLLAMVAAFMYVYAALPLNVVVSENPQPVALSKEAFFYIVLAVIAVANALVFVVARTYAKQDGDFKAWFYGLIVCANIFFIVGLSFISLYNSNEKYDFGRLGVIIYGSVILLVIWAAAWPVYRVIQRLVDKQPL